MNDLQTSGSKTPKKYDKKKKKYSKQEKDFLTHFAITNGNKVKSMKLAKLDKKKDGTPYDDQYLVMKAYKLLETDFAREYIHTLQKQIMEKNCFTLERAVNETYENYQMLKERNSFHEMNIALDMHYKVAGLIKPQGVNVQTQIVAGENGLTINYITPKKEDDNSENK